MRDANGWSFARIASPDASPGRRGARVSRRRRVGPSPSLPAGTVDRSGAGDEPDALACSVAEMGSRGWASAVAGGAAPSPRSSAPPGKVVALPGTPHDDRDLRIFSPRTRRLRRHGRGCCVRDAIRVAGAGGSGSRKRHWREKPEMRRRAGVRRHFPGCYCIISSHSVMIQ